MTVFNMIVAGIIGLIIYLFLKENISIQKIKSRYIVSVFMGFALFLVIERLEYLYGHNYYSIMGFLIITFLLISSIKDVKDQEIPLDFVIVTGIIGVFSVFLNPNNTLLQSIIGISIGSILIVFSIITKNAIGQGDGLVICIIGLVLGWQITLAILLYGLIFSAFYSGYLLLIRRRSRKTSIPFVPFLLIATLLFYLI